MTVPTRNGLQYSSVNGTSTLTANYPAGSSSGDLVILQVRLSAASTTARTISVDGGGWTNLITNANAGDGTWTYVWWKFRGAETSVTITPSISTGQRGMGAQVISYSGSTVHSSTPIDASNVVYQQPAATTITGPTITTTGDDRQILQIASALWVGGAVTVDWSAGVTEIADNSSSWTADSVTFVASTAVEDKASAGVTTARTATFSQSMFQRTILTIAVAPAPGPSTGVDDVTLGAAENATRQVVVAAPGPDQVGQSSATGTGTNLVINYPAGSLSGDYIVAVAHFYKTTGTTAPAITTPSGWTLLKTQTAGGADPYRVGVYGRFRGAETSVTFVADTGTNVQSIGAVYAYRNVDAGVPVTDSQIVYELDTDSTFSVPSVTPTSVQNRLLKAYISNGQYQSAPAAAWASSTEVLDIAQTIDGTRRVNLSMALGYQETAAASGAETVTQAAPLVSLTALGMDKSGSQTLGGLNTDNKVTGWTPQAGTSAGDIVNDTLIVNGSGNITVSASVGYSGFSSSVTARIYRNGVQVASGSATSVSWTGDVVQGDALELNIRKTTSGSRTVSSASLAYTPNGTMVMFASDDFAGTGALNSTNWTTDGGGTLVRTSGELDGTGTPSVPLSFAWWKTPANSGRQLVKARIRWNGRNPEHSTAGLCVRADPFQSPLVNPGAEHGVMGTCTANLEAFYYEDYDQSDGGFSGLKFVTGSGGATSTTKYADNSLLEVESNGNTYTYRVNGVVKKSGTVSTSIIPETYRYVGLFIQDDSAESGGGEPPAMLDDFEAWHEVPSGSGDAHTFGVVVALQAPQDIQINSSDSATLTGTESHSIAGILTAPTDAATVGYADNAPSIAHTGQAADAHPVGYADTVSSFTGQTSAADAVTLTATETVVVVVHAIDQIDVLLRWRSVGDHLSSFEAGCCGIRRDAGHELRQRGEIPEVRRDLFNLAA